MSPIDDNSRRDVDRVEENPFIAFRRFADANVSSLLNMALALPATVADFASRRQRAHYQCLFGQADASKCIDLLYLENKSAEVLGEIQELELGGQAQTLEQQNQWVRKRQELENFEKQTDSVRREILGEAYHVHSKDSSVKDSADDSTRLVERVGKRKGREVAGDWDWDWPVPSDESDHQKVKDVRKRAAIAHNRPRPTQGDPARQGDDAEKKFPEALFHEFGNMFADEVGRMMRPFTVGSQFSHDRRNLPLDHHDPYSPRVLEDDQQLRQAGISWRDAFEDLLRAEVGANLIPKHEIGQSSRISYQQWVRRFWGNNRGRPLAYFEDLPRPRAALTRYSVPWEGEERSEEPNYEYAHDHEDQHDDPPTPTPKQGKFTWGTPATELDAYERLLGSNSSTTETINGARPSVLSTLTTTEQTMAPDGTVTTKTVLKKRFADGREETSESVRTQSRENFQSEHSTWRGNTGEANTDKKKGWFWSN